MKTNNKILAIDCGRAAAWCYLDDVGRVTESFTAQSYIVFYDTVREAIRLYKPVRFYNATVALAKQMGLCCYLAEKAGIPLVELADVSARKALFGKGNIPKVDIPALTGIEDGDEADAFVLAKGWSILSQDT